MRRRIALVVCAFIGAFFVGAPVFAEDAPAFPDLPGMKLADEATRGQVAPSVSSGKSDAVSAPAASTSVSKTTSAPDAGAITSLPGTGPIPVLGQMKVGLTSSRRGADTMPRGLAALAAIGTIVSVGAFLLFRDRVLGRPGEGEAGAAN